jgi:hypothetical protein
LKTRAARADVTAVNRLAVTVRLYHDEAKRLKQGPPAEEARRMTELASKYIQEIKALRPDLRKQLMSDVEFGMVYADRSRYRYRDHELNSGVSGRHAAFQAKLAEHADDPALHEAAIRQHKRQTAADAGRTVRARIDGIADLKQAKRLGFSGTGHAKLDGLIRLHQAEGLLNGVLAVFATKASIQADWFSSGVLGDAQPGLEQHIGNVNTAVSALRAINNEEGCKAWLISDGDVMSGVLDDTATALLDFIAVAIDTQPRAPPGADGPAQQLANDAAQWLKEMIACGADLAHVIRDARGDAASVRPRPKRAGAASAAAGQTVVVNDASGIRLAAQLQADGSAVVGSGEQRLRFEKVGGEFVPAAQAEREAAEAQLETELSGMSLADAGAPTKKSTRLLDASQRCLDQDIQQDLAKWKPVQTTTNPNNLMTAYGLIAHRGEHLATRMHSLAGRHRQMAQAPGLPEATRQQHQSTSARLAEHLSHVQSQLSRLAQPAVRLSLIKGYVRPQAEQWSELLSAGQVAGRSRITALDSDPADTVFECAVYPQPDADGRKYPPVWLHLHAKQAMTPDQVQSARADDFDAVHLKSDIEKNRGQQWVQAQRESGQFDAAVHRSRVPRDLLEKFQQLETMA